MSQEELFWAYGVPALACAAVLLAVFRPWSRAGSAGGRWAGANALAVGLAVAFLAPRGWAVSVPPRQDWQWLVYLAVAVAIAVGYGAPVGGRGTKAWTMRLLVAGLAAYLIVGGRMDDIWVWRGVTAAMIVAAVTGLERLSDRVGNAVFSLSLGLAAAGAGYVLWSSGNQTLAHMAWVLSACLGVAAILAKWRPSVSLGAGGVLVAGMLLPGLVMSGYFYGGRPSWCLWLAALAPAACWLTELPAAQKYVAHNPLAFRAGSVVAAAGVAVVGILIAG